MNKSFDELLDLLDIPHTKGSGWYEDRKLKVEQWLERQQNSGNTIVSGSLPLAELQELKNTVNVLLLFAESDGEIINGYRTKEIVQELKKLCGNDC